MFQGTIRIFRHCIAILAVTVAWTCRAQEAVYHDNVVIVLDTSGSMNEDMQGTQKLAAAKAALKEVLNRIPDTTHVGLLVFGSANDWLFPLGPREEEKLLEAIDRPNPDGGTPLGAFLKIGADRLLERRREQYGYGTYRLLVVTDGEAQDQELVDRFAPEIMARGITLDVIGVAMRQDHTLAQLSHSYRRADDPASLQTALAEVFAEVSGADDQAGDDDSFDLIAPIPVDLASAMIGALATSGNEPIGERPAGSSREQAPLAQQVPNQPPQPAPSPPSGSSGGGGNSMWWLIVVGCIILFALATRGKSGQKRRRRR
jgi:uncharacterized protein YegL